MDREKFKKLLKLANMNKKDFSNLSGMAYSSVNNWGSAAAVPPWVESWLVNYIELQQYKNAASVREKLAAIGADNSNLN